MKLTITPKGNLEIDDAIIIYRNFAGEGGPYNREGDRNFAVLIPDEDMKNLLVEDGWNVKVKPSRRDDEELFMYLPVKVKYTEKGGPTVYVKSRDRVNAISEANIGMLDNIEIAGVDLDIRPYDWDINGKTGRTAYLQSILVTQKIDRFAARFMSDDDM